DNCEDPDLLRAWRPRVGGCRVLVTSRKSEWSARLLKQIRLGVLPRPASLAVLLGLRAASQDRTVVALLVEAETTKEADALGAMLGDLPLALALAGAYLESHPSVSVAAYRAELAAAGVRHPSLNLPKTADEEVGHAASVRATFTVSYDALDDRAATDA